MSTCARYRRRRRSNCSFICLSLLLQTQFATNGQPRSSSISNRARLIWIPADIESAITFRTKAIIVVHTFGCPAELEAVFEIAGRHDLRVIADACEAIGAEYNGREGRNFRGCCHIFLSIPINKSRWRGAEFVVTQNPGNFSIREKSPQSRKGRSESWFSTFRTGLQLSDLRYQLRSRTRTVKARRADSNASRGRLLGSTLKYSTGRAGSLSFRC